MDTMSFHDPLDFLSRPVIGVTTSLGSVLVSLLPHLETGMRVSALALGLFIAVVSARKTWRDRNK
jgi:hydrogenase/urease accessory protein HupE